MAAPSSRSPSSPARRERTRPGGRSERVRRAVAEACLALLAEGRVDFTMQDVAERSGVNRTTIYRWWPTHADLLAEALSLHTRSLDPPDTGSWEGDVHALAEQLAAFFSNPVEVTQNRIMASGAHPEFNDFSMEYYAPIYDQWRDIVHRAVERGEIDPVEPDRVLSLLASPLIMTTLMWFRAPTQEAVRSIAELVVRATVRRDDDGPTAKR